MRKLALCLLMLCVIAVPVCADDTAELCDYLSEYSTHIDGSTATIPLGRAIVQHFLPDATQTRLDALVQHSKTANAYEHLLIESGTNDFDEQVDLIFVTEPFMADYSEEDLEGLGLTEQPNTTPIDVIPIAHEALVFLNNVKNPVTNLSANQLRRIYSGKITRWSEVGGNDVFILPFQRNEGSGSQTLFLQQLMKDVVPMSPPQNWLISDMGFLIESVAKMDNADNALGYSVYYYVTNMYGDPGLRMLSVDGILPTDQTIADGSYPIHTYYYAVMRSDLPADHPARKLVAWLLSDEGQAVSRSAGYLPVLSGEAVQP